ncbi:MAG: signal peptidase I [Clostridiales bacterium]|jgi:signal peptidase I|nr:signal peptidase I [Clostridiales bacterium]
MNTTHQAASLTDEKDSPASNADPILAYADLNNLFASIPIAEKTPPALERPEAERSAGSNSWQEIEAKKTGRVQDEKKAAKSYSPSLTGDYSQPKEKKSDIESAAGSKVMPGIEHQKKMLEEKTNAIEKKKASTAKTDSDESKKPSTGKRGSSESKKPFTTQSGSDESKKRFTTLSGSDESKKTSTAKSGSSESKRPFTTKSSSEEMKKSFEANEASSDSKKRFTASSGSKESKKRFTANRESDEAKKPLTADEKPFMTKNEVAGVKRSLMVADEGKASFIEKNEKDEGVSPSPGNGVSEGGIITSFMVKESENKDPLMARSRLIDGKPALNARDGEFKDPFITRSSLDDDSEVIPFIDVEPAEAAKEEEPFIIINDVEEPFVIVRDIDSLIPPSIFKELDETARILKEVEEGNPSSKEGDSNAIAKKAPSALGGKAPSALGGESSFTVGLMDANSITPPQVLKDKEEGNSSGSHESIAAEEKPLIFVEPTNEPLEAILPLAVLNDIEVPSKGKLKKEKKPRQGRKNSFAGENKQAGAKQKASPKNSKKLRGVKKRNRLLSASIIILNTALALFVLLTSASLITEFLSEKGYSILGLRSYIIQTDSMRPELSAGSFIVSREVPASEIKEGSVIIYRADSKTILTRRITSAIVENGVYRFIAKADANAPSDLYEVSADSIQGVMFFSVKGAGAFLLSLHEPVNFIICVAALIFLFIIPDILRFIFKSHTAVPASEKPATKKAVSEEKAI